MLQIALISRQVKLLDHPINRFGVRAAAGHAVLTALRVHDENQNLAQKLMRVVIFKFK